MPNSRGHILHLNCGMCLLARTRECAPADPSVVRKVTVYWPAFRGLIYATSQILITIIYGSTFFLKTKKQSFITGYFLHFPCTSSSIMDYHKEKAHYISALHLSQCSMVRNLGLQRPGGGGEHVAEIRKNQSSLCNSRQREEGITPNFK
jgi:hypothetical protein